MKKFALFSLLLITISCTITRNASIEFKEENTVTLTEFLDAKETDYEKEDVAVLKDFRTFISYNDSSKLVAPEAYFFNKEGYRVVNNFKGTRCALVISNIDKINSAPIEEKKEHISDWIKDFSFLSDNSTHTNPDDDYDVYVILSWAKFADHIAKGSINETTLRWYKSLKENPDLKIKTILLNIDVQESWALTDEHKEAIGMKNSEGK